MKLSSIRELTLRAAFLLGPTGIFFTPIPGIGSLRTFYFTAAAINLLSLFGTARRASHHLLILFFIFILLLFSASHALLEASDDLPFYTNPIIRVLVIANLMFGFFNAAQWILASRTPNLAEKLLHDSYIGFCLVFFLGMILYLGYINGKLPATLYNRFITLDQVAYGYSRFSPGTYPNEFGILCSFYALYSLILLQRKRRLVYVALATTFAAGIFLTSTRAAYLTLIGGYLYLILRPPTRRARLQLLAFAGLSVPAVIALLSYISFDIFAVVMTGYESAANGTGSSSVRLHGWNSAFRDLMENLLWGVGIESPKAYSLHNLPLQIFYGLGLLGSTLLAAGALLFAYHNQKSTWNLCHCEPLAYSCLSATRAVLAIHVVIFGLTNHNQAHFFTWMLFALTCLKLRRIKPVQRQPNPLQALGTA
ncbi:O-antigen ligase family protein [Pseudomonas citronellolis]|uniref:O-antigen ligase family protein n=1 Tax=Pseudomonas citronellolis TaxID=53408 RepID=UPI0023E469D1|nr:O-antigen ligase family protein [Pseudomonas citronellolis]MDF3932267.1 O-antigen ligase family protein [Pseudomonas citronellolis]